MKNEATTALKEIAVFYIRVKGVILLAEEIDPEYRSNIMPIKELRDAFDHIMRCHAEDLSETKRPDSDEYIKTQVDKIRGHVCRAGYDTVDGYVVGTKVRLAKALNSISNEAIAKIYPDYYNDYPEFERLANEIVQHRKTKDIGTDTLANLDAYMHSARTLAERCSNALTKVPLMLEYDKKEKKKIWKEKVLMAVLVAVIAGISCAGVTRLLGWEKPRVGAQTSSAASTTNTTGSASATKAWPIPSAGKSNQAPRSFTP